MPVPYQEFPPDLRRLTPRTSVAGDVASSIVGINVRDLPDGAVCFAQDVGFDYRYRKESTTAASGDDVVAPLSGPGRWFKEAPGGAVYMRFGITDFVALPDGVSTQITWNTIDAQQGDTFAALEATTTLGGAGVRILEPGFYSLNVVIMGTAATGTNVFVFVNAAAIDPTFVLIEDSGVEETRVTTTGSLLVVTAPSDLTVNALVVGDDSNLVPAATKFFIQKLT